MNKSNPLKIAPLGNALFSVKAANSQEKGLGQLALLSHELLQYIFSCLEPDDCLKIETTSKVILVLARQENIFKEGLLQVCLVTQTSPAECPSMT